MIIPEQRRQFGNFLLTFYGLCAIIVATEQLMVCEV